MTVVGKPTSSPDDAAVSALVAGAMTLPAALKETLLRRLIDALHVERERNEAELTPTIQRDIRLVRALRSVADEIGHPPSTTEYKAAYERARTAGDPSLPTVSTFIKRYRSWKRGLFAAGLIGTPPVGLIQQRALLRTRPARYPLDRLIACVRACRADIGRVPSVYDYDAWREQKRRESIAVGRVRPDVPHRNTICARFGSWPAALATAGFDPSLEDRNPPSWWTPVDRLTPSCELGAKTQTPSGNRRHGHQRDGVEQRRESLRSDRHAQSEDVEGVEADDEPA